MRDDSYLSYKTMYSDRKIDKKQEILLEFLSFSTVFPGIISDEGTAM